MSKDYRNELNDMYRLMNYGMNESKKTTANQGIVEYSQLGADGKTYGILKEGTKYYVKVAPKKNTAILAEDFDYVGGRDRRKAYESYTKASNALNLQLISVNEAAGSKKPVQSQYNLNESAEWKNAQTKEARTELNRFYQLVSNVDKLLSENVHYINENDKTYSEKPTKSSDKCSGPCGKQQNLGIKDKDWTKDNSKVNAEADYKKYGVNGGSPSGKYNAASGINQIDMTQGNPYQETAKTSKEQGKAVCEGRARSIKLSEEQKRQVLAWRDDRAFVHNSSDSELDRSHGTEIGDTAPWTENVNENFDTTEWDEGLPTSAGIGEPTKYKAPFTNQKGVRQPVDETYIFEVELGDESDVEGPDALGDYDEYNDDDAFSNDIYAGLENGSLSDDEDFGDTSYEGLVDGISDEDLNGESAQGLDAILAGLPDNDNQFDDEEPIGGYDDTDAEGFPGMAHGVGDSVPTGMGVNHFDDETGREQESDDMLFEVTLNDFGKHPAYRKKPMTLPKNADGSQWGEDWNDESTKGEQPYGRQIGHSGDPFTDKVDAITNAVVTALSKKKI